MHAICYILLCPCPYLLLTCPCPCPPKDKAMANKNPWESYNPACEYQNYASMNVLDPDPKDSLEMTAAEWEKCVNLPLDVQEGDFQTEVWSDLI